MEIQIAVAKINKYAVSESGDTLEVIERPTGGLSVVLADGQTSGRGAKAVSMMVVRKVISLIAEGVRDGAAARAASDALFAERAGKVTCTLNIASVDMLSKTIVLARNNPATMYICRGEKIEEHAEESVSLGTSRNVRPVITELTIEAGLTIVIFQMESAMQVNGVEPPWKFARSSNRYLKSKTPLRSSLPIPSSTKPFV